MGYRVTFDVVSLSVYVLLRTGTYAGYGQEIG